MPQMATLAPIMWRRDLETCDNTEMRRRIMADHNLMSASAPLKIYIQDVYRAHQTDNQYIYELFSTTMKKIMIHGVITQIYSVLESIVNLELTDPTGSVHVFYNCKKSDFTIHEKKLKSIHNNFEDLLSTGHDNLPILKSMKDAIIKKQEDQVIFTIGSYLQVIGDIFTDKTRSVRMVSAFECNVTSAEREIVWLTELYYLYEKFYLWKKIDTKADDDTNEDLIRQEISNLRLSNT